MKNLKKGFTLIEILVVIGIIAVLAAIVIVAINPARQFAQARDSQRQSNVSAILNAIGQNIADNKGIFACSPSVTFPNSTSTDNTIGTAVGGSHVNLEPCLVPTYLSVMLMDPSGGTGGDTKYWATQDSSSKRITVSATGEVTSNISVTR